MKKLLDDVFCEHILNKNLLDKATLAQIKKEKNIITARESLLLKECLSLQTYRSIIAIVQKKKSLVDTDRSMGYDKVFLDYALKQNLISQEDINLCQMQALSSPFSTRELLLVSGSLDYEAYCKIFSACQKKTKSTKKKTQVKKEEEIVDATSKLSIVCDNSAETIIDINPLDNDETPGTLFTPSEPSLKGKSDSFSDDSEETLIDQEFSITPQKDLDEEEATLDIDEDRTLDIESVESVLPTTLEQEDDMEATLDIEEKIAPQMFEDEPQEKQETYHRVAADRVDSRLQSGEIAIENTREQTIRETPFGFASKAPREEFPSHIMQNLIQEVQKEVNRQTQRINQSVGMEVQGYKSGYKILSGVVTFFSLFLLAFIGWIEFQRSEDLRVAREEKKQALAQKDAALNERMKMMQEKLEIQRKLGSVSQLQSQVSEIQKLLHDSQKQMKLQRGKIAEQKKALAQTDQEISILKRKINKDKQLQQARQQLRNILIYQKIGIRSSTQALKQSWKLARNDFEVLISMGTYFYQAGKMKSAISFFRRAVAASKTNWSAYVGLARAYTKQRNYPLARSSWKNALKANPILAKIAKKKLRELPK